MNGVSTFDEKMHEPRVDATSVVGDARHLTLLRHYALLPSKLFDGKNDRCLDCSTPIQVQQSFSSCNQI